MTDAAYFITDRCIAGGAPPFVIRQSYCVRCGVCTNKCPVNAIIDTTREKDRP